MEGEWGKGQYDEGRRVSGMKEGGFWNMGKKISEIKE